MAEATVHCLFEDEGGNVRTALVEGIGTSVTDLNALRECVLPKLTEKGIKQKVLHFTFSLTAPNPSSHAEHAYFCKCESSLFQKGPKVFEVGL